jgi:hypothetical protein
LYPIGFTLDFWEETASYRPGWQAGDGHKAELLAQFIRVLTGHLADLYAFSGFLNTNSAWFVEDFDDTAFVTHSYMQGDAHVSTKRLESIKAYQPGVEAA